jgi:crossover junction endodeoxyribonuclease RusA
LIAITLPWPSRSLHPNARVHWARKAQAAKAARQTAGWCAKEAGIRPNDPDIPDALKVNIVFFPPNARAHDLDGCLSSMKSALDGIADALGCNDSKWEIAIRKDAPVKGGSVRIELEAAQ